MTEEQLEAGARAAYESFTSPHRAYPAPGQRINKWEQLLPEVRAQWRAHVLCAFAAAAKLTVRRTPLAPPEALIAQADVK